KDHVIPFVVADGNDRGNALTLIDVDEVGDEDTPGGLLGVGDVEPTEVEDAAGVGEEEEVIVAVADAELHDGVFFADRLATGTDATAALDAEFLEGRALDVAALAECDDAFLVGNEVLLAEVLGVGLDDL